MPRVKFPTFAVAVAALIIAAGCARKSDQPADTTLTKTATMAGTTWEGMIAGKLTQDVDSMTGEQLVTLANTVQWTGSNTRGRVCGGKCTTKVKISANPDAIKVDSANMGKYGVLISTAINLGTNNTESMYGFKTGPYEYYFVAYDTGTGMGYKIAQISRDANHAKQMLAPGAFHNCSPTHVADSTASADFKTCAAAHAMRLDKRVSYASILDFSALLRALSPRRDTNVDPDPPAWVSCAYGCCTFGEGT